MEYEYYNPVKKLTIATHYPGKWRFYDAETGELWKWNPERDRFMVAGDYLVSPSRPPL